VAMISRQLVGRLSSPCVNAGAFRREKVSRTLTVYARRGHFVAR
jgi:hypothetical protein